jgi:hypothetical protein
MITQSISSKPHPPLKLTENYSLMVMESEPMVVGDDVGDGDDEEALESLSSRWRSWSRRSSVSRNFVSFW